MSVEILRGSACVGIDTFADQDAVSIPSTNLPGRKKMKVKTFLRYSSREKDLVSKHDCLL